MGPREFPTHHILHAPPLTKHTCPAPPSRLRPNYPVAGARKRGLTLYCPESLPGPKAGRDLDKALKGGQKEDDLALTARPSSDPLKMTHHDPETRAPHLTCCSCSVRKLTSCFRLPPPFIGTSQAPPPPTNCLVSGIRWAAAAASVRAEDRASLIYPPPPGAMGGACLEGP